MTVRRAAWLAALFLVAAAVLGAPWLLSSCRQSRPRLGHVSDSVRDARGRQWHIVCEAGSDAEREDTFDLSRPLVGTVTVHTVPEGHVVFILDVETSCGWSVLSLNVNGQRPPARQRGRAGQADRGDLRHLGGSYCRPRARPRPGIRSRLRSRSNRAGPHIPAQRPRHHAHARIS